MTKEKSKTTEQKVYPVNKVPVPLPASLIDMADQLGITQEQLVRNVLYGRGKYSYVLRVDDFSSESLQFVPGHIWGAEPKEFSPGPVKQADVMIVDKMLDKDALDNHRIFSGTSGEYLYNKLATTGHKDVAKYYVTTLLKTVSPDSSATYKQQWSKDQYHFLLQEIYLVKPKFMLLMGADVLKIVLGKNTKIADVEGVVQELTFQPPGEPAFNVKALVTMRPDAMLYASTGYTEKKFIKQLSRFRALVAGKNIQHAGELKSPPGHKVIDNEYELVKAIKRARKDSLKYSHGLVAVDCEWEGSHPQWRGAYLRCVQFTGKEHVAYCVALTHPGGEPRFKVRKDRTQSLEEAHKQDNYTTKNGTKVVAKYIQALLKDRRMCGHQIKADLEWLEYYGMNAPGVYEFPEDPHDCKTKGPFDTLLAAHAYDEQAELGLKEQLAVHLPHIPNYEAHMQKGIKKFLDQQKADGGPIRKKADLEGYGNIADEDLYPYACLRQDSLVQLGDETWEKIRVLVRDKYAGEVRCCVDGKIVNRKVIGWHRTFARNQTWFKVITRSNPKGRFGYLGPAFTPDHEIYTNFGKVRVDKLVPGVHKILTDEVALSKEQKQIVLGSLLGDGGINLANDAKAAFLCGQVPKQAAYAEWKIEQLANWVFKPRNVKGLVGFISEYRREMREIADNYPRHSTKDHDKLKLKITPELLEELGPLGLAVWYQDDGTLCKNFNERLKPDSSRIYARKLNDEEIQHCLVFFSGLFGEGVGYNEGQGFIEFRRNAFHAFHEMIQPYMHTVMQRKTHLPVFQDYTVSRSCELFYEDIKEIRQCDRVRDGDHHRYCLTVDEAHNFVTTVGIVSNCWDADAGLQLAKFYLQKLDGDQFGNDCWKAYHISLRAFPVAYEITKCGLTFNPEVANRITFAMMKKRSELLQKIRETVNWPDLNLNSAFHQRELLFGTKYNGKADKKRLRPDGAKSMLIDPILSTGKYQVEWQKIRNNGKEFKTRASTNSKVMGLLLLYSERTKVRRLVNGKWKFKYVDAGPLLKLIRQYKAINQQLRGPLRPPTDPPPSLEDWDADEPYYDKGIPGSVCTDGKVRTSILQSKETGRWSSVNPPLMNISSQADALLRKIFEDEFPGSVKNILEAEPGWFLVPVDLSGAELRMSAVQSQDKDFIDATARISLPEDHPDHMDIHGEIAVDAFNLDCRPTKSAIEAIGKGDLRTGAKVVIFGKFYGQGIASSVMAVRMRGTDATFDQMERISEAFDAKFPLMDLFFDSAKARVDIGYMATWAGRIRRFPRTNDMTKTKAMEREALNAPIQGGVADFVSMWCYEAWKYRNENKMRFQIVLQKHDELIFHVPKDELRKLWYECIPYLFEHKLSFYAADFEGRRRPNTSDYRFFYDRELMHSWGINVSKQEKEELLGKDR